MLINLPCEPCSIFTLPPKAHKKQKQTSSHLPGGQTSKHLHHPLLLRPVEALVEGTALGPGLFVFQGRFGGEELGTGHPDVQILAERHGPGGLCRAVGRLGLFGLVWGG